jgi:hypothetical protein
MKLSRVVAARLVAAALMLCLPRAVAAQNVPKLSRSQRAALEAVVTAVDEASASATSLPATWQSHVLRASDGSHYIALRATVAGLPAPRGPVILYARLASRAGTAIGSVVPERSAVLEWLKGRRGEPLPMQAARSTTVNVGEMPVGGTAAAVGDVAAGATAALRLVELQRERLARQREDERARREAELERTEQTRTALFPFEDFDPDARLELMAGGEVLLMRGVTAGPGDYDLFIAWADPSARDRPHVSVVTRRLQLPAASSAFGLGEVVVAEDVRQLTVPYTALQQASHPYAFGGIEVVPASDNRLSNDGTLGLMYQVVNPTGSPAGKPDIEIGFQLYRTEGDRTEPFARLEPQRHHAATLPHDFDVALGHPIFGAVRAPLTAFPRGRYRIDVTAIDRLTGRTATRVVALEVKGSPASLLREAPSPALPFRREHLLTPRILASLAHGLRPPSPSAELARALAAAEAGRFAELVQVPVLLPAERPIAQALLGLGLYGLGDSPRAVTAQLTQAANQGAPSGPIRLVLGAVNALQRDDAAAVEAWNGAREGGLPDTAVAPLLVDAYLRRNDIARAAAMARAVLDAHPADRDARRALAATFIASRRFAEAIDVLDGVPSSETNDLEADFLRLHALFAAHVGRASPPGGTERFERLAAGYVDGAGQHAALVREWLAAVQAAP